MVTIERIKAEEWRLLREMRLAALADAPEAFGQRFEEARGQPEAEWQATTQASSQGDRRAWFVARDEARRPLGIVQARRRPPDDCLLFSMWVAPEARRSGAGRALVHAVEEWGAKWGARRVVLWVIAGNEGAMRFYDRIDFRIMSEGPDAQSGYAYGAIAMERAIGQAGVSSGETQRRSS